METKITFIAESKKRELKVIDDKINGLIPEYQTQASQSSIPQDNPEK